MIKLLYATTNVGKLQEMRRIAKGFGIDLLDPISLGIKVDVEESGKSLSENACKKAEAYLTLVDSDTYIVGDDTGMEIDALGGEPGIYVRRWKDHVHELSDEEVIEYCLQRMAKVPVGERQARFHTSLALAHKGSKTIVFDGYLDGEIALTPLALRDPGMPFHSLFYLRNYDMMLGHILGIYPTHREMAFTKLATYLASFAH
jgi:XTP/dITP diphosphohydrolase